MTVTAIVIAGVPSIHKSIFHRLRFDAHDPAVWMRISRDGARDRTIVILRDIEIPRASKVIRADRIAPPSEFAPAGGGLSGDREIATAQAAAECLRREGVTRVRADRATPFVFADFMRRAGISVECDEMLGVLERRAKDEQEVAAMRAAQQATEGAIKMACETIARAKAGADGVLILDGSTLTAERVMSMIDVWLLERGYLTPGNMVVQPPHAFDCHHAGAGPLRTGVPTIVDVFPVSRSSHYNGDCTRTVVHGSAHPEVVRMHRAVADAKAACIKTIRAGVSGDQAHAATIAELKKHGYERKLPPADAPADFVSMQHGTGHGLGLDLKEPPLIEVGGPTLIVGDAVTVEPGLYHKTLGGIRLEDLVLVTADGCVNLNTLHEGLNWS